MRQKDRQEVKQATNQRRSAQMSLQVLDKLKACAVTESFEASQKEKKIIIMLFCTHIRTTHRFKEKQSKSARIKNRYLLDIGF